MWEPLIDQIVTILGSLLAAASTAFLAWLTIWLRTKFKLDVDAARSLALNTAVDNAAGGVLNKLGETALTEVVAATNPAVKAAVAYVQERNPEAVAYFDMQGPAIAEKVINAIGKLTAPAFVTAVAKPRA